MWVSYKAKKRKLLCCPQVEFLNIWVGWIFFFFWFSFLKSTQTYRQNLGAFSPFFSKKKMKKKKKKNHLIWQRLGAFPTLIYFILFLEMGRSLAEGNTTFFSWPNAEPHHCKFEKLWEYTESERQLLQPELPRSAVATEYSVPLQLLYLTLTVATAVLCYMRPIYVDGQRYLVVSRLSIGINILLN